MAAILKGAASLCVCVPFGRRRLTVLQSRHTLSPRCEILGTVSTSALPDIFDRVQETEMDRSSHDNPPRVQPGYLADASIPQSPPMGLEPALPSDSVREDDMWSAVLDAMWFELVGPEAHGRRAPADLA